MQKHNETALDTPKNEGTESSFPVKMHLIPGKTPAIYKIFCGANVVQNPKEKSQILETKDLRFDVYPEPGMKKEICGKPMNLDSCV